MTVDRNAMARALISNDMTEDDLFIALDGLRSLTMAVLEQHELDPALRTGLQSHVDRLRPILNATFRPVGIESDPFVPRYAGSRIEYRADERGFAVAMLDKDGRRILRPYMCNDRLEIVGDSSWDVQAPEPAEVPLSGEEIISATKAFVARLAAMWELPLREPHVAEANEESEMEMVLASLQSPIATKSASPRL
jgi:hypothetical protein|nr:hypothetical protein [Neorhizobium tomejilense]